MKTAVGGAAIAIAVSSAVHAAAPALPKPSGYFEVYGQAAYPSAILNGHHTVWPGAGIFGHGTLWLSPSWSTQIDAGLDQTSWIHDSNELYQQRLAVIGAHVNARDPNHGLFGGFAGFGDMNAWQAEEASFAFAGLEGQLYANRLTFYAQAGDAIQLNDNGSFATATSFNMWFAQAVARFFVDPNTKLEGGVGYFAGNVFGNEYSQENLGALTFEAEVEHRFAGTPVSLFARASGMSDPGFDNASGAVTRYTVVAGLSVRFGRKTLEDDDRSGTTLTLPDFQTINWGRFFGS